MNVVFTTISLTIQKGLATSASYLCGSNIDSKKKRKGHVMIKSNRIVLNWDILVET